VRTFKPYLWALGLLWGVPALLVAIGYVVLDKDVSCDPGTFGCMSDAEGLLFFAFLVGAPILGGLGVLAAVTIAVVQSVRRTRRARSVPGA
jgi:hypothetical protein